MAADIDSLVEQIKTLSPEQQVQLAEALDRLTWTTRWTGICERIDARAASVPPLSDEVIDREVAAVRNEHSLSARSSTHPS